ncbi:hypothetical protein B296_00018716 [Ensete ventricosum]|uniref:BHLH domain-containing protein n=1 Tax=Ensete ventricosum TaxID=4639 RepID=A0A427ASP3_ENSVE|nr:hypothetical protein B296_00018716 [Ensete ventricosum]
MAAQSSASSTLPKNIMAERERRNKFNKTLYDLRSVMSKTAIILDAINYIQELQEQEMSLVDEVSELESKKQITAWQKGRRPSPRTDAEEESSIDVINGSDGSPSTCARTWKSTVRSPVDLLCLSLVVCRLAWQRWAMASRSLASLATRRGTPLLWCLRLSTLSISGSSQPMSLLASEKSSTL